MTLLRDGQTDRQTEGIEEKSEDNQFSFVCEKLS